MPAPMFAEERRRAILERLRAHGRVVVPDLVEQLRVSAVTIRSDLSALEEIGVLERTYGGAVLRADASILQELSFNVRQAQGRQQKSAIAAAAASLLADGCSVALDCSTTAYALLPFIKRLSHVTVITNSLRVAQSLLGSPQVDVLLPAGRLRRDAVSIVGSPASLPSININLGFFGARGITAMIGVTEIDSDEAIMKRTMYGRCVSPVIVLDGSKWGQVAPYTIVPPSEVRHVITSGDAPEALVEQLRTGGVRVTVVPF
ncbi:MAG: DeoR/GlpR family DNA-binding transcription regulator [Anaerolineae bacterium]|nr:DeoR/GlpR family DNA-binding transcription regulator [Anaerolineae bacterium]